MTQALELRQQTNLSTSESDFRVMREQSIMLVKTGFLPRAIDTPEKAMAIILTGRELGIPTMTALRSIDVIQGKPTISPQLMMALINRSGELENLSITNLGNGNLIDAVQVVMKRRGRDVHTEVFSRADAQTLGLLQKDNWKKQTPVMLKWRAVAACARVVFPDVILGLYTPDEMGAETEVETIPSAQIVPVDIPQADLHEDWTLEQLEEFEAVCERLSIYTDFIGYSPTVVTKMNAKIDSFATIGECWDALEKVAVEYYEKLSAKITEGLTAQDWDAEEIENYLGQFDVTALIEATRDQLEIVYADMKDSKMI